MADDMHDFCGDFVLRLPVPGDALALNFLVGRSPPLDSNSVYCNLLQCSYFADTSIVATSSSGDLIGFVSGYLSPLASDTLFIWQVVVDSQARGKKLAKRMLSELIGRSVSAKGIRFAETTINPGNVASEALFDSVFKELGMPLTKSLLFSRDEHFGGRHDDEILWRAGPF